MGGPLLSVLVLSAIGTSTIGRHAGRDSADRRARRRGVSPASRGAGARGVRRSQGPGDVDAHLGGSLGFALAPLVFAPAVVCAGSFVGLAGRDPRAGRAHLHAAADAARRDPAQTRRSRAGATCGRTPSRSALLYIIVVLRTLTANSLAVFLPVLLTRQGMGVSEASAAVSLYLFISTVGGFLGGPLADAMAPRRVIIWTLLASVPFLLARPAGVRLDADGCWSRSAGSCCSRRCRST